MSTYVSGLAVRSLVALPHRVDQEIKEQYTGILAVKGMKPESFGLSASEAKSFNPDATSKDVFIPIREGQTTINYIVQPGDTLSDIALATGTDLETLIRANHIKDPNKILIGQKIKLPLRHTVSINDFTHSIADTFTPATVAAFPEVNPFVSRSAIMRVEPESSAIPSVEESPPSIDGNDSLENGNPPAGDFVLELAGLLTTQADNFINNKTLTYSFGDGFGEIGVFPVAIAGNHVLDSLDPIVIGDQMAFGLVDDVMEDLTDVDPNKTFKDDVEDDEIDSGNGIAMNFSKVKTSPLTGETIAVDTARIEVVTPYRGDADSFTTTFSMAHFNKPEGSSYAIAGSYVLGFISTGHDLPRGEFLPNDAHPFLSTTQAVEFSDQRIGFTIGTNGTNTWGNLAYQGAIHSGLNLYAVLEYEGLGELPQALVSVGADIDLNVASLSVAFGNDAITWGKITSSPINQFGINLSGEF